MHAGGGCMTVVALGGMPSTAQDSSGRNKNDSEEEFNYGLPPGGPSLLRKLEPRFRRYCSMASCMLSSSSSGGSSSGC